MKPLFFVLLMSLGLSAHAGTDKSKVAAVPAELGQKVVARYIDLVIASYAKANAALSILSEKVDALVKDPSESTLNQARVAWIQAREAYSPTEAFRFYGGPIDHAESGVEGLINAWPMDEAYLDYVKGQDNAGIINNPKDYPKIDKDLLVAMNEKNGEKNISTGFHAIEFLLWGQDLSLQGPGDRKASDFSKASPHGERRSTALRVLTALLVQHLEQVALQWSPSHADNYGALLKKEPLSESLRKIFTALVSLSVDEMAGERMIVALDSSDQENEQSCFSDTTTADFVANQKGIQAVYFDSGLNELVQAVDPALAKKSASQLKLSMERLEKLPKSFDQVIAAKPKSTSRKDAQKVIESLERQGRLLAEAGKKLGLNLNIQ
jgi:putative iron-regulated protein